MLADKHIKTPKSRNYIIGVEVLKYDPSKLKGLKDLLNKNKKNQYVGVRVERVSNDAILTLAFNVSLFNEKMGIE